MGYWRSAIGVAMYVGLVGCDAVDRLLPGGCSQVLALGIGVAVVDSLSNVSLVNGATVLVRDGTYSDSVTVAGDSSLTFSPRIWLVPDRPGTYAIGVRHAGYSDWSTSNVRVVKDGCHVKAVFVDARLTRAP